MVRESDAVRFTKFEQYLMKLRKGSGAAAGIGVAAKTQIRGRQTNTAPVAGAANANQKTAQTNRNAVHYYKDRGRQPKITAC